ncbi:MAG: MBL fold metallo-hydrolase [Chlamydiota bacterium]
MSLSIRHSAGVIRALATAAGFSLATAYGQQLDIHCIDVGQGSSELFIGPDGTTVLVDGGGKSEGQAHLLPYLNSIFPEGKRAFDYLIASHDDNDHVGGLNVILSNGYQAGTIYNNGVSDNFGRGVAMPLGTTIPLGNGAVMTCVKVYTSVIDGTELDVNPGNDNGLSIVLLVEYGDFDYITGGDLGQKEEPDVAQALISYVNPPSHPYHPNATFLDSAYGVEVLHPNHHAGRSSTCASYVNILKPEFAIINGGTGYSDPTKYAVDRLLGRERYTIDPSCSGGGSSGDLTGVTWHGLVAIYRTTYGDQTDCARATEQDCPVAGNVFISTDGRSYCIEGTYLPLICRTTDEAPTPTPTITPTPTVTPTPTPWIFPRRVNFQPSGSSSSGWFCADDGSDYGTCGDFGWVN